MSLLLYVAFASEITPNTQVQKVAQSDAYAKAAMTWGQFLKEVFSFWDIFEGLVISEKYTDDLIVKANAV